MSFSRKFWIEVGGILDGSNIVKTRNIFMFVMGVTK